MEKQNVEIESNHGQGETPGVEKAAPAPVEQSQPGPTESTPTADGSARKTPAKKERRNGSRKPKDKQEPGKLLLALIDHGEKIVALVVGIVVTVFLLSDDVFHIAFWLLMILGSVGYVWYYQEYFSLKRGLGLAGTIIVVALISYTLHDYLTQPRFTLRLPGTQQTITTQRILGFTYVWPPFTQPEPFEITDNLIRASDPVTLTKADRERIYKEAEEKNEQKPDLPEFTDGLHLSINPQYKGTKPIQKVALRITGKNKGFSKVKTIWEHIESASPQGEIDVTMPELVEASQISFGVDDPVTNLNLAEHPFPESEITLEIIDEMNPDKPLSSPIHVKIQNAPWLQLATTAHRKGAVYIDYYLKNLGRDGNFFYHVIVAKITGDVGLSDNPVWNGTTWITSHTSPTKIALKKGESYQTSIPISELPKGRYVVEVFTVKEQDRVQFDTPVRWDGFSRDYFYANPGNNLLIVDCNDIGETCTESVADVYPIEKGSPTARVYDGQIENSGGMAKLKYVTPHLVPGEADRFSNTYTLEYSVEPQVPGYAGLWLVFDQPVDLSSYTSARMKIKLSSEKAPILFRIGNKEGDENIQFEVLIGDGIYGKNITEEQIIEVPLSEYVKNGVDLSRVSFITFFATEKFVPSANTQTFEVGQIEFFR